MTLATRCPQCATAFRVAPDQIKLRGGWVRCGVCNEVFDSSQSLIELDPAGGTPRPVAAGPASLSEAPAEPHVLRRRGEGLTAPAQDGEEPSFAPESAPPFFALPDVVGNESVDPPTRAPSPSGVESSSVSGDVAPPLASDEGLPSVLRSRRPAPAGLPDEARAEPEVEAERQPAADNLHAPIVSESRPRAQEPRSDEAPDFLDQDVRRRRRRALWLWSLAALIALLVLLA